MSQLSAYEQERAANIARNTFRGQIFQINLAPLFNPNGVGHEQPFISLAQQAAGFSVGMPGLSLDASRTNMVALWYRFVDANTLTDIELEEFSVTVNPSLHKYDVLTTLSVDGDAIGELLGFLQLNYHGQEEYVREHIERIRRILRKKKDDIENKYDEYEDFMKHNFNMDSETEDAEPPKKKEKEKKKKRMASEIREDESDENEKEKAEKPEKKKSKKSKR